MVDGEDLGSRDKVEPTSDGFEVDCVVEGDYEPDDIILYVGNEMVVPEDEDSCKEGDL